MLLNRFSIAVRLVVLSTVLLLATVLVGALGWWGMRAAGQELTQAHRMAHDHEKAIDLARSAQVSFKIQVQEWKNLLLRGHQPEPFQKYRQAFIKEGAEVQRHLAALSQLYERIGLPTADVVKSRQSLAGLHSVARKRGRGWSGPFDIACIVADKPEQLAAKPEHIEAGCNVLVRPAMRYGNPSIASQLDALAR